ncbi:MAG: recombination mediator RecR [Chitinophagaceae bacterium]|nr:recombination mediator RecR [Chitinophagaceae bacterium]MCW5928709.1 recombination mediator RecR [Chitinophagaceae bacterium]
MQISSSLLENAVNEFSRLPGVGKKTALRLVLHLIRQSPEEVTRLTEALDKMKKELRFCQVCHNIADNNLCNICANPMRRKETICVVENIRDVIALESTQQYSGLYHVLGGIISPLDGIGPDQLNIETLVGRVNPEIQEIIFALSPNIQGDTTIYYIQKKLEPLLSAGTLRITTIARGISFGGELEYADELTLGRSIQNRMPVEKYVSH